MKELRNERIKELSFCLCLRFRLFVKMEYWRLSYLDCATTFQKLYEDPKQYNSTFSLRTCHCAECVVEQNLKDDHLQGPCSCLPRFSVILQKSNPILRSTLPKTLFWIAPQTFMRVVLPVRMEIHTFTIVCSRTVWRVAILPWVARPLFTVWRGPRYFGAFTDFLIGTAYPRLFMGFSYGE